MTVAKNSYTGNYIEQPPSPEQLWETINKYTEICVAASKVAATDRLKAEQFVAQARGIVDKELRELCAALSSTNATHCGHKEQR